MPNKQTLQEFIKKAQQKHGNKYDYSNVNYINNGTLVEVICPTHGSFNITPASHSSTGRGCSKCKGGIKYSNNDFITKALKVFPDYDYSSVNYINAYNKVSIICQIHGKFYISPCKVLQGYGCQKCSEKKRILSTTLTNEEFVERSNEIHSFKYDYSSVNYINNHTNINIICPKHGEFLQIPNNHISKGYGCSKCSMNGISKQEKEVVNFTKTFYSDEILENSRSIIGPKELDIFISAKKFAIEYNGLFWHSSQNIDKKKHLNKTNECLKKNINLFHIFSDEWANKQEIIKSMIKYRIGMVETKIHGRKCKLVYINKEEGKEFFINNHISGDNKAQIYIGLKYDNKLVSCLSLKKPIQKKYGDKVIEIARFANLINTTVNGGFQKLFKFAKKFAKDNNFDSILTYADRRFGEGHVYLKSGLSYIGKTPIDYWYTNGKEREFRFKYRAQKEPKLTEKQVAENSGVYPIYGCGSNIYLYSLNEVETTLDEIDASALASLALREKAYERDDNDFILLQE